MLRRLALRDFVIVPALEVEFGAGFTVLTGETGAGKSILVDALQLALGGRGDAGVVREGAPRAEIAAEFDAVGPALAAWLAEAGLAAAEDEPRLLLRRVIDAQGKSRAWINGSAATVAQLREAGERLVDIHGQHAWQGLTRSASVRALLDAFGRIDCAPLAAAFAQWRADEAALHGARTRQADLDRERERLTWQLGEIDKLDPAADEWEMLNADHARLANAQALIDAAQTALALVSEAEASADALTGRAADALDAVAAHDAQLAEVAAVLQGAQAQLQDAAHTLAGYLHRIEPDPAELARLDARLSAWVGLARRYRRTPDELPALRAQWRAELDAVEAAGDLAALEAAVTQSSGAYRAEAAKVTPARRRAAQALAKAVTQAMQQLGMAGGRFEVALEANAAPQSWGLESAEFLVAGHAGSTPRPLAKVASGGELSRIALAVAVTTSQLDPQAGEDAAATLIFDEIGAGIGGAVAEVVGRLMKQLGAERQVLAVTHLAQVAASADQHLLVSKLTQGQSTASSLQPIAGEARVAEIARMLGGERISGTGLAHAQELLAGGTAAPTKPRRSRQS